MPAVKTSFVASARTYGARRIWRDVLEAGFSCGLHKIERLMRAQALRARPRRRALPKDDGERPASAIAPNVLDRQFTADQPNRKWIADFTYVWTAEGWLYVAAVIKWAKPSKCPVQHREAWRPRTKPPSKAEALRRLLDAINRNDEAAREMLTPRPDLLKAWLKAA